MGRIKALKLRTMQAGLVLLALFLSASQGRGQTAGPTTHTIFMTAVELKGATTTDKLKPPSVDPKDLSKGYEFKPPGRADKSSPKKWEVSSYRFDPGFVTIRQGDTVKLVAFVVNGDEHEVQVNDPDGRAVIAKSKWNRGREYQISFVAKKVGTYHLTCSTHAPTMAATFLVLPRK